MRNITISLLFFIFIVQSFGVTVKFRLYCEDLCSNFYLKNDLIPISGYYQQDKFNTYPTIEAQLDDTIKIEITKSTNNNNTPKISGYVNIDGYIFHTKKDSVWVTIPNFQEKPEKEDFDNPGKKYKVLEIQQTEKKSYFFQVHIPFDPEHYSSLDDYEMQFQCPENYVIVTNFQKSIINFKKFISPNLTYPIKIVYSSNLEGTLKRDDITTINSGDVVSNQIAYYYPKNEENGYKEEFSYYVFKNGVRKDCDDGKITLVVCKSGCSCHKDNFCSNCLENYAHKKGDLTKCYSINEKIEGYFYSQSFFYFDECSNRCKYCTRKKEGNNHNCLECQSRFNFFQKKGSTYNCYVNCHDDNLFTFGNECVSKCPSNYPYIDNDGKTCVDDCSDSNSVLQSGNKCSANCGTQYPIDGTNKCTPNCKKENTYLDTNLNKCLFKCPSNKYKFFGLVENFCTDSCTNYGGFVNPTDKTCIDKCPEEYPYILPPYNICTRNCKSTSFSLLDKTTKRCTSSCPNFQHRGICLNQCPQSTIPDVHNKKCIFNLANSQPDDNSVIVSNISLPSIQTTITEQYLDYASLSYPVKGQNYILQVYDTSSPLTKRKDVSNLLLNKCEITLRNHYHIESDEKIYVIKIDVIRENSPITGVDFFVYDQYQNKLNLSLCNNEEITISHPVNKIKINFELGFLLSRNGIDIYNSDDDFFNNICNIKEVNNTNVILADRRDFIYQNYTLCGKGCSYEKVDYDNEQSVCNCLVHLDSNDNDIYKYSSQVLTTSFSNNIIPLNMDMVKCFSTIFIWENLRSNYAFWTMSMVILGNIISFGVNILFEITRLSKRIDSLVKGNPPGNITAKYNNAFFNNNGNKFFDKENDGQLMCNYFWNYFSVQHVKYAMTNKITDSSKEHFNHNLIPGKKEKIIREFIIYKKDFDNYPFCISVDEDKRSYCNIFINIFKQKNSILSIFFHFYRFDLLSLKLSIFLFHFCLLFFCNALFISNNIISKKFVNDYLDYLLIICRSLISCVCSYVVILLINLCFSEPKKLETYFFEMQNDKKLLSFFTQKIVKKFKLKIIIFGIINMFFIIFFGYYNLAYCSIYKKHQLYWLLGGGISFLFNTLYSITLSLLIALFKSIGLNKKNNYFFNISLFMHKFG